MQNEVMSSDPIATELLRLTHLDSEVIRREFAAGVQLTLQGIVRMAACLRVLEDRGEDISDLRGNLVGHLRRIAYGQLAPELVVRFGSYPLLLGKVAELPIPDQRWIASGGSVELIVARQDEQGRLTWDRRQVEPSRLTREQIHQVFGNSAIRTEAEQKLIIEDRLLRPVKPAKNQARLRPDRERGGLVLGRSFVARADVVAALAALRGDDENAADDEKQSLVLNLSAGEHRRLKVAAAQGDTTMCELTRQALRAAGLI